MSPLADLENTSQARILLIALVTQWLGVLNLIGLVNLFPL